MRAISGSEELISELCGLLGVNACGADGVCLSLGDESSYDMLDGYSLKKTAAHISVSGSSRVGIIRRFDTISGLAANICGYEGVISVKRISSGKIVKAEDGLYQGGCDFEVVYIGG